MTDTQKGSSVDVIFPNEADLEDMVMMLLACPINGPVPDDLQSRVRMAFNLARGDMMSGDGGAIIHRPNHGIDLLMATASLRRATRQPEASEYGRIHIDGSPVFQASDGGVTQADREAAADVPLVIGMRAMIRAGKFDDHPLVQAFARHRLTHSDPQLVEQRDRLAEALRYARRFLNPQDHDTAYVDDALRSIEGGRDGQH